jgi:hypothetical protein
MRIIWIIIFRLRAPIGLVGGAQGTGRRGLRERAGGGVAQVDVTAGTEVVGLGDNAHAAIATVAEGAVYVRAQQKFVAAARAVGAERKKVNKYAENMPLGMRMVIWILEMSHCSAELFA